MDVIFEDLMFIAFIVGSIVLLIYTAKTKKPFRRSVKLRSIAFAVGYLLGMVWQIADENLLGVILCIVGFTLSQFVVALTFYQDYKDSEIPYE